MLEIKHILTEQDLAENPSLADYDMKVGDEVSLVPVKEFEYVSEKLLEALEVNEQLLLSASAAPAEAQPVDESPLSELSFEHEGESYGFVLRKVQLNGEVITADDVVASEELQAKLVAIGSGMIVKK